MITDFKIEENLSFHRRGGSEDILTFNNFKPTNKRTCFYWVQNLYKNILSIFKNKCQD